MTQTGDIRVLFVCTANECRSPFAAALAQRRAEGLPVVFDSAGVETWHRGVPETGLRHARELGLDLAGHVSTTVHPDFLDDYDIVLGLARNHVRELATMDPGIGSRLFTLKQFAAWAREHPRSGGVDVRAWLATQDPTDWRRRILSSDPGDDVQDPINRPLEDWRAMSADLIPAIDSMVDGIFPPVGK